MLILPLEDAKQLVQVTSSPMTILILAYRCVQMNMMSLDSGGNADQHVFQDIMPTSSTQEDVEEIVLLILLFCMPILRLSDVFNRTIVQLTTMETIIQAHVLIHAQGLYLLETQFQECV